jgi:hypothetical protein
MLLPVKRVRIPFNFRVMISSYKASIQRSIKDRGCITPSIAFAFHGENNDFIGKSFRDGDGCGGTLGNRVTIGGISSRAVTFVVVVPELDFLSVPSC